MLAWLTRYTQKPTHTVIGLMSGTSADGIDAAVIDIEGTGETLRARLRHFITVPFPEDVRQRVLRLCRGGDVTDVCALNFVLGELFADAALQVTANGGLTTNEVDLIGSHGQTVCHLPQQHATLQIGEPSVIAERTGITTVAEFRYRDMAAGGEGAPLVPYVDYLLFRHPDTNCIVQNIGGIANFTFLPAGGTLDDVLAFDTGPGNMVIDECVRILTNGEKQFDEDGRIAAQGTVDEEWLNQLMQHPFFHRPPPKSTGREDFGRRFSEEFIQQGQQRGLNANDIVATATALTAESIALHYRQFPNFPISQFPQVILGGGGAFNPTLRRMLQERVAPMQVLTHEDFGYDSNAKEAMAFAILAHETVMGTANNVPSATGARRRVVMGKIIRGVME